MLNASLDFSVLLKVSTNVSLEVLFLETVLLLIIVNVEIKMEIISNVENSKFLAFSQCSLDLNQLRFSIEGNKS